MLIPGIWTAIYVKEPLTAALRKLHGLGWEAFECSTEHLEMIARAGDPKAEIAAAKETLAELGLSMPQAHAYLRADVAAADVAKRAEHIAFLSRDMRLSAKLGVKNVVIHPGRGTGYDLVTDRRRIVSENVESFRRLGDEAGELGLRIGIENMPSPVDRFGVRPEDLLDLLARLDHPALGVTFDTDHAAFMELNQGDAIRALGPHICATHISDSNGKNLSHRTPGTATIDWSAVMKAFGDIGYEGIFNLEIPGERHPAPELLALKMRHARAVTGWLVEQVNAGG